MHMCERTPCQGTPEEMRAIMEAGLGHRLMIQYRENSSVRPKITHVDYAPTGAPDLVLDAPAVNEFAMFVMAFKHGLSAVHYYNTNEQWALYKFGIDVWNDQYNFGGNGDGTLMYPDRVNQTAFPSIRLKLIREASQWADVITAAGMQAEAAALMTTTLNWDHDLSKVEALREKALAKL